MAMTKEGGKREKKLNSVKNTWAISILNTLEQKDKIAPENFQSPAAINTSLIFPVLQNQNLLSISALYLSLNSKTTA